ncbi:MAG TPA: hypothetical protein VFU49_04480, partial [Ktedonobacteraceae bacterium]|nr:hypothetical protein [Ktedonobacteraceae bacterium]
MSPRCRPQRSSQPGNVVSPDQIIKVPAPMLDRRTLLKVGGLSATTLATIGSMAWLPQRIAHAMPLATFPDIQFDIVSFIAPAKTIANVQVQF